MLNKLLSSIAIITTVLGCYTAAASITHASVNEINSYLERSDDAIIQRLNKGELQ